MKVLMACEESQAVCKEFRKLGHEAYSADILECSGGHPEWHIQGDVLEILHDNWDLVIAFPPCTHLAVSGSRHFEIKRKDGRQQEGIDLFMEFTKIDAPFCIENPVGIMSTIYREPDQIIHPYYFGDPFSKTTCLWLSKLNPLKHVEEDDLFDTKTHVDKGEFVEWTLEDGTVKRMAKWYNDARSGDHGHKRSKTFPGIAKAMASQWSNL